ncbi:hypothetical protein UN64_03535 [Fictibacillus arsenicus]|uniref:Uncharacterized protein n=1 Tax=Fictibacillus arsenicus TaxID=255247 RepID=A0A1V3GBN0_9BACL|nr:hypothetical protein UN64_03535 [Fictibacillus arsenicus]
MIEAQGARLLRDKRSGETPQAEIRRGGSPLAPRKASILERKSTTSKATKITKTEHIKKGHEA